MAITHVNVANSQATGATQIVHTLPASLATGDVVVVGVSASGSTDLTFTEPGGTWTPIADLYSDDGRDTNFGVFLKVMGAVPDTDVTISVGATANLGAISTAKRGVDTTTPLDVASVTATGINTPDADPGSITPVTNGAEVIVLGSWGRADGTITFPSGYTNTTSRQVAGGGTACALGSKNIATAGPEDPGIFDLSTGDTSDAWAAVTVALRPAGGGGGSTYTLDADAAAYTYSATDAALQFNRQIDADAASYVYTAQDAGLQFNRQVDADAAAYAWTAQDAGLEYNRQLEADSAAYTWTANDADLEYTPSGTTYTLAADSAAYLWSATDADLIYTPLQHYTLDADAAAYLWSASDAGLEWSGAPSQSDRPTGGWDTPGRGNYDFLGPHRPQHLRQKREEEREELHITEQQQRKIDRAAVKIAREGLLTPPAIMAAPSFDALLSALQPTEGMIAALVSAIMERASWIQAQQLEAEEEAAIIRLLMEL